MNERARERDYNVESDYTSWHESEEGQMFWNTARHIGVRETMRILKNCNEI